MRGTEFSIRGVFIDRPKGDKEVSVYTSIDVEYEEETRPLKRVTASLDNKAKITFERGGLVVVQDPRLGGYNRSENWCKKLTRQQQFDLGRALVKMSGKQEYAPGGRV